MRMAAYSDEDGRVRLEKVSFALIGALFPFVWHFNLMCAAPARFGHFRKNFRLNSLHERRRRNMMARVVRRELSVLSNLIPAVKRSPKTSFQQPFVPQTLPPGRT